VAVNTIIYNRDVSCVPLSRFDKMISWAVMASVFFLPLSTGLGNIFYTLTLVLALIRPKSHSHHQSILRNPLTYVFWGFALIVIIGIFYTTAKMSIALICAKKFLWLLFTPFLFWAITDKHLPRRCLNVFLLAVGLTLLLSYAKYLGWVHIGEKLGGVSVFKDHIVQSYIFSLGAAIALYRVVSETKGRWFYALLVVLISLNMLYLSRGRIGYLILPILFIFTWLKVYGWRTSLIPCVLCFIAILGSFHFSPSFHNRVMSAVVNIKNFRQHPKQTTSMGIRLESILDSFEAVKRKPFFGYGTGGIQSAIMKVQQNKYNISAADRFADSGYLNMLVQYGFFGLGCLFIFFYFIWFYNKQAPPEWRFLLYYVLVITLVGNLFNTWITETTVTHLFSIFCALAFYKLTVDALDPSKRLLFDSFY